MAKLRFPFHLAFPVRDLEATRKFYVEVLRCKIGRESPGEWIDFDLFGHQISAHLDPDAMLTVRHNQVDGHAVPVRHFGVILSMEEWDELAGRLRNAGTSFVIEPHIRFLGAPGEQATMFFLDPSGNTLEFKAFADPAQIFAH